MFFCAGNIIGYFSRRFCYLMLLHITEAVSHMCLIEKLFWKFKGNSHKIFAHRSLPGSHYEKVRIANAVFSLALKSLTKCRYFVLQSVVKNDGNFVCKHKHCNRAITTKQLQRSRYKKWRRFFLHSNLPYLYLVRIQTICFLFAKFLTYPRNKHNNKCFLDLYREYCPRSLHWTYKLGRYLDLGEYVPATVSISVA